MQVATVIGTVVASQKAQSLVGVKLLIVQFLNDRQEPIGNPQVAGDTVQAGVGDLVMVVGGREAAVALPDTFNPADYAIVGIIDSLPG
ncbi:MAG: EutN/CcmL family microcompartment protein [Candidatus Sericytochromatia bacterium]|nr:EutN/CcmL family microcompartment protein [Candidatus Sericytochromatia bacterium]